MAKDLLRIFSNADITAISNLEAWWRDQLNTITLQRELAEERFARARELSARLGAWRDAQARPRVHRDVQIMRLRRRGLCDDEIAAKVDLSPRQVRRIIKRELRR